MQLELRDSSDASSLRDSLRMDATRELLRRGIGYIVAFQDEADTADLREHSDLYAVREVAHEKDASLFQILPSS
jgi:hypothetical protein